MNKLLIIALLSTSLLFTGCVSQEAASIGVIGGANGPEQEVGSEQAGAFAMIGIELHPAVVSRVMDGDTVELDTGEKVRLIGINTPESTKKHEPYGEEAKKYTKKMLEGKSVYLENDISETDRYGRLLKYVWLIEDPEELKGYVEDQEQFIREHMFNAILVAEGYAEPYTFPPDVKYEKLFIKLAREAREQEKGLWALDPINGTTRGELDGDDETN